MTDITPERLRYLHSTGMSKAEMMRHTGLSRYRLDARLQALGLTRSPRESSALAYQRRRNPGPPRAAQQRRQAKAVPAASSLNIRIKPGRGGFHWECERLNARGWTRAETEDAAREHLTEMLLKPAERTAHARAALQ